MVGVGSEFGLGLGFTADDRRLGLYSGHQVMVRVRVSSSRQGALRLHEGCAHTQETGNGCQSCTFLKDLILQKCSHTTSHGKKPPGCYRTGVIPVAPVSLAPVPIALQSVRIECQ